MINIEEFHERKESMELWMFQNVCLCHMDDAKDTLLNKFVVFWCRRL